MELLPGVVAPAVPLVGVSGATLITLIAWSVVIGLAAVHRYTIGWVLRELAGLFLRVSFTVLGKTFTPLKFGAEIATSLDRAILAGLAYLERNTRHAMVALWRLTTALVAELGDQIAGLADDTLAALQRIATTQLPVKIALAVKPLWALIRRMQATLGRIDHVTLPRLGARIGTLDRYWRARLKVLGRGIDRLERAVTQTLPRSIASVRTRVGTLDAARLRHHARLNKLERVLAPAAFATLVMGALARKGLGWLRCTRVNRVGRHLCGMDAALLDFLLGAAVTVFVFDNLCSIVSAMQDASRRVFEPALLTIVNEVPGSVCGGRQNAPSGIVASDWQQVGRHPSGV